MRKKDSHIVTWTVKRERERERMEERRKYMRQQRFSGDPWLRYIILALTLGYKEYRQGGAADITLVADRLVGNILYYYFFFSFPIYIYLIFFSLLVHLNARITHDTSLFYIIYTFLLDKNRPDLSPSSILRL